MGLFRKSRAEVIRRGVGDTAVEERTTRRIGGSTVEITRVREVAPEPTKTPRPERGSRTQRDSRRRVRRPEPEVILLPPSTERKQMLVRRTPYQTQIVVLEGALLVEHHVARSDRPSLTHNIYLGRVRNVLPGMEAAFVDFGEPKNGVLYAGDIQADPKDGRRRTRIEKALKVGDEVLVQVVKDAMGHKGARLTNEINLSGRYVVLDPNVEKPSVSRRLGDAERERLRDIAREISDELGLDQFGVIVRTAAEGASKEEIRADIDRLLIAWNEIMESVPRAGAPRLIHEEPPLVIRVIREHFTRDFRRLLIDDTAIFDQVVAYLADADPDLVSRVQRYDEEIPIFERFHVEDQLRKALDRKVWLPSGGHVVVDRTEALTVIDVNTGRFVGHSNLEETVLQNNLEAAEEIAHQLRLRDIGGIIVIDFIDMEIAKNRDAVLRRLRESLAKDKTRTQVFEVSNLGLVEMTRKNESEGLLESFSHVCPTCAGRGVVLYEEAATTGAAMPHLDDEE
ncbi:MAG TPA: Rne/Rng family ribonuclease [Acidimicrobiia bacterium]|nr:Rne/Rng family ribonuclease [Acidimicrobiia bacterium]